MKDERAPTGQRLAAWCEKRALSAADIQTALGVSQATAYRILAGTKVLKHSEWIVLRGLS